MALLWYWYSVPKKREPVRRKADGERRDALIKVLATPDERDALQTAADAAGMSLSTWVRHVSLKAAKASG